MILTLTDLLIQRITDMLMTMKELLERHAADVQVFADGGAMSYELEAALWEYHFDQGNIRNYDCDASEFLSRDLCAELGLEQS